jgi:hypothetical protein
MNPFFLLYDLKKFHEEMPIFRVNGETAPTPSAPPPQPPPVSMSPGELNDNYFACSPKPRARAKPKQQETDVGDARPLCCCLVCMLLCFCVGHA